MNIDELSVSLVQMLNPIYILFHVYNNETQSVQSLSHVQLFVTPQTAACQAFLSMINSWSLLKLMSIKLVMPSNHLIHCRPLLLLPSIFSSIRVFSNESVLQVRQPKYRSFSFNISPSNEPVLIKSQSCVTPTPIKIQNISTTLPKFFWVLVQSSPLSILTMKNH